MSKFIRQIKNTPDAKTAPGETAGKPVTKTVTRTGRQVVKSKAPAKTETKAEKRTKGFWGIVAGTKKEAVAIALDAAGREAAMTKAKTLGIAEGSAKGWIGFWKRGALRPAIPSATFAVSETVARMANGTRSS